MAIDMDLPAAVIFDMDGLLVDSEPLHAEAFIQVFHRYGIELSMEQYREHVTMGAANTQRLFLSLGGTEQLWPEVIQAKHSAMKPLLAAKGRLMPGVTKLLASLSAAQIPSAVATSARRRSMEIILGHFDLTRHFAVKVALEDAAEGKPSPAPFLLASEGLGAEPRACIVFEDSPKGVLAAYNAGMKCIAVPNASTADGDFSLATLVVDSLEHVDIPIMRGLWGV